MANPNSRSITCQATLGILTSTGLLSGGTRQRTAVDCLSRPICFETYGKFKSGERGYAHRGDSDIVLFLDVDKVKGVVASDKQRIGLCRSDNGVLLFVVSINAFLRVEVCAHRGFTLFTLPGGTLYWFQCKSCGIQLPGGTNIPMLEC